jgi:hypothetical protein
VKTTFIISFVKASLNQQTDSENSFIPASKPAFHRAALASPIVNIHPTTARVVSAAVLTL